MDSDKQKVWDILSNKTYPATDHFLDSVRYVCKTTPEIRAQVDRRLAESRKYWSEFNRYK